MKIIDAHIHFTMNHPHFNQIAVEAGYENTEEGLRKNFADAGVCRGIVMGNRSLYPEDHEYPDFLNYCIGLDGSTLSEMNPKEAIALVEENLRKDVYKRQVRRQVKDMDIRRFKRVLSCLSLKKAWEWMADMNVVTLPIVDEEGYLTGIITEGDIAESYMGMYDSKVVSQAGTSYKNLVETLGGELVVGDKDHELTEGKVLIAAANPDTMEEFIDDGDLSLIHIYFLRL